MNQEIGNFKIGSLLSYSVRGSSMKRNKATEISQESDSYVYMVFLMSYDLNGNLLDGFDRDDCMLIGVYSSQAEAEAAILRSSKLPGFSEYPDHFVVDRYILNKDNWTSGFGAV